MNPDVQFSEDTTSITPSAPAGETGLIGFLIKRGWAKDTTQANKILIGVLVVVLLLIAFVFVIGF